MKTKKEKRSIKITTKRKSELNQLGVLIKQELEKGGKKTIELKKTVYKIKPTEAFKRAVKRLNALKQSQNKL